VTTELGAVLCIPLCPQCGSERIVDRCCADGVFSLCLVCGERFDEETKQ